MRKCRVCKSKALEKVFSLGDQPLVNYYPSEFNEEVDTYPLELFRCTNCELIQLGHIVDKNLLYSDKYPYIPSVSKTNLEHFQKIAQNLVEELSLNKDSLVVDVGSNDGSLLECFNKLGTRVLGIEPAFNLVQVARKKGIRTYHTFFTKNIAAQIVRMQGKAKLVTMTNVFAHIDDLHKCLEALDIVLDENGVFFAQFPDVRNLLRENQFDTIYHEHLSYFGYESLNYLFANSPFELYKMSSNKLHGGSMQIQVRRRINPFGEFIKNTAQIKADLQKIVKTENGTIAGFGAAAKGMILLNYCNLDYKVIKYIVDGTSYKQGKYTPITNIPIYPEEHLLKDPPDMILILAWNFKDEIINKLKGRGYTFIVPIPSVEIIKDA